MPSNTAQLLESDDTEPDLPVPVQNLSGLSLRDDEGLTDARDGSYPGTQDRQPLSRTGSEEDHIINISGRDADLHPGTFVDESHGQQGRMMMMAMMMMQEGEKSALHCRRKSVNTTECVMVPTSEHVAEIVGRQGCKIKALRAKTNTYIKTPVRGEEPVFVVTGRKEDVVMAKREILSAAEHFSLIRASRNKLALSAGPSSIPCHPGQTSIQVRVPYRMVGLVVGPKGATIKRIQQQTHTYIVTPSRDKEPVFEVTGMPENVDRAREEIQAHIAMRTAGSVDTSPEDDDFHYNGTDVGFESGGGGGAWLFSNFHSNDSSSSLGSTSSESYYGGKGPDLSPGSSGGSFWFGSEDSAGYDGLTMTAPPSNPSLWSATATPRLSPSLPEDRPLVRLRQENLPTSGSVSPPGGAACVRCGDSAAGAGLVLGGSNLVCLECSGTVLQHA